MMRKSLLSGLALLLLSQLGHAAPLCSYETRISQDDKFNSSGRSLINGDNKASLAAIIRQDRANFYVFRLADPEDEADCVFSSKDNRARMEEFLQNASVTQRALRTILYGTPLLRVTVYSKAVEIQILNEGPSGSSVR